MATKTKTTRKPPQRKRRRKIVTVRVKFGLFRCKTCRKPYNLPWRHVCMIGFTPAQAAAARRNLEAARRAKR